LSPVLLHTILVAAEFPLVVARNRAGDVGLVGTDLVIFDLGRSRSQIVLGTRILGQLRVRLVALAHPHVAPPSVDTG
jgi:hypothetical protein